MENRRGKGVHDEWALFRLLVVGWLLSCPPRKGELAEALKKLAGQAWKHPITGEPTSFGFSTIERWYYRARGSPDAVGVLRRKVRRDQGQHRSVSESVKKVIFDQYSKHPTWSYDLHHGNLVAGAEEEDAQIGPVPSYETIRKYMQSVGLVKVRRSSRSKTVAAQRAQKRLEDREVRSYEVEYVNGLWHLDFHECSRKVLLTSSGQWVSPRLLVVIDDRSRLVCHAQWYLSESAENLVHGLCQAIQKRALFGTLMTDNGKAELAREVTEGLGRLSILHWTTLVHSPYQNGKGEVFFALVEGRLLPMLESVEDLDLATLNDATQALVEMDYNRSQHSETKQAPIERYLDGPDVGRPRPSSQELRMAFAIEETRRQRASDGSVSIEGRRYEIPGAYRHLRQVVVRYARWDLGFVHLVDPVAGKVLCRIFPQDKGRNSDGVRRVLPPGPAVPPAASSANEGAPETASDGSGISPLLAKWMKQMADTGLPSAYLPKEVDHGMPDQKRSSAKESDEDEGTTQEDES